MIAALPLWAWAAFPADWRERLGSDRAADRPRSPLGFAPAALFGLWYNWARFGSPIESGYYLAALPAFLEAQRALGLFSPAHLSMNIDLFVLRLPALQATFPFFRPDGLGMSVLVTSPGLLYALRAPFRDGRAVALGVTFVLVLLPNLLYYGGGWLQMGYRYALDAIPFAIALAGMAAARGGLPRWAKALIAFGVLGRDRRRLLGLQPALTAPGPCASVRVPEDGPGSGRATATADRASGAAGSTRAAAGRR